MNEEHASVAMHVEEPERSGYAEERALPSCEVLEVARPGSADLLVPLVRDAIRMIDVEERRIDVDLAFLGEER